jgi:hypothetical protein
MIRAINQKMDCWIVGFVDFGLPSGQSNNPKIQESASFGLALPLFVPRVGANHPNDAFAPDDLAILAQLFN